MYFMTTNQFKENADFRQAGPVIAAHIEWAKQLISRGLIVQAGKWGQAGGMCIVRADTLHEAQEIIETDPLYSQEFVRFSALERFFPDVPLE